MSYTINHTIDCCNGCVPPKRHPGCHSDCPDYREKKAIYDREKAEADKKKAINHGLDAMAIAAVNRASKIRGGRK